MQLSNIKWKCFPIVLAAGLQTPLHEALFLKFDLWYQTLHTLLHGVERGNLTRCLVLNLYI